VSVHTVLLFCELGILGITFAKLASDTQRARATADVALAKKDRHHITLTVFSCIFTLISFSFTVTGTYVMSRILGFRFRTISSLVNHAFNPLSLHHIKPKIPLQSSLWSRNLLNSHPMWRMRPCHQQDQRYVHDTPMLLLWHVGTEVRKRKLVTKVAKKQRHHASPSSIPEAFRS
jgi:hypothetical protein